MKGSIPAGMDLAAVLLATVLGLAPPAAAAEPWHAALGAAAERDVEAHPADLTA